MALVILSASEVGDGLLIWLTFALTMALVIAFILLTGRKPIIQIFNDGIVIKDFMYPTFIPNDTIKSIGLLYKLPNVLMRSNGYGGAFMWKGFFRLKEGKRRAVFYLENHNKAPFIEILTTNSLYFINLKNEEQTKQLYDEMVSTIKLVNESRLVYEGKHSSLRSIVVVSVFVALLLLCSLIPIYLFR